MSELSAKVLPLTLARNFHVTSLEQDRTYICRTPHLGLINRIIGVGFLAATRTQNMRKDRRKRDIIFAKHAIYEPSRHWFTQPRRWPAQIGLKQHQAPIYQLRGIRDTLLECAVHPQSSSQFGTGSSASRFQGTPMTVVDHLLPKNFNEEIRHLVTTSS